MGSLTLGGYDSSRSLPNNLSFPLSGNNAADLNVGIKSITASNILNQATPNSIVSILSSPITAVIDTTLPFFYLPLPACAAFENAFELTWNADRSLYLVNDTTHQGLLSSNPSVTFTLGEPTPGQSINITLPYGAFDLQAASPIFPNGTNYFPLRRATKQGQYTLGRAFLQETYVFVEYEKSRFSISQTQFPSNPSANVVTVDYLSHSDMPSSNSKRRLSRGATAGIVIGCFAAFFLLCVIAFFLIRRRCRARRATHPPHHGSTSDTSTMGKESWPCSPNTPATTYAIPNIQRNRSPSGNPIYVGELENPVSGYPTRSSFENNRFWPPASNTRRQELPSGETAKELPPTPEEKAKVYELASEGRSGSGKPMGKRRPQS